MVVIALLNKCTEDSGEALDLGKRMILPEGMNTRPYEIMIPGQN